MAITLLLTMAVLGSLSGCGGTALDVEAPPGVDVRSASVKGDETFTCDLTSDRSGVLNFDLHYFATSENVTQNGVLSFTEQVEAGEASSISEPLSPLGSVDYDVAWGTLVLDFE